MIKRILFILVLVCLGVLIYFLETPPHRIIGELENKSKTIPYISFVTSNELRNPASTKHPPRQATVLFKVKQDASDLELRALDQVAQTYDLKTERKIGDGNVHFAKAQKYLNDAEQIAEALNKTGAVEFAEPDSLILPNLIANDPMLSQQWHHTTIRTMKAWDSTMGTTKVIVASCDTGVDPTHPDLQAALLPAFNSEDMAATNLQPVHPHGTMTAGAMAAIANNLIGVSGVAGKVKILPIKITNFDNGAAYLSAIANCITYAADHGAKVVNLSYGGTESATIDTAAKYLRSKGGFLVIAAGNDGLDTSSNIDYASMYIVSATDQNDQITSWSNRGFPTDIVAPGVDILTTNLGGGYVFASGTSLAAPLVSGTAALVYSIYQKFTAKQVESILSSSANHTIYGYSLSTYGAGRVDAANAVYKAKQLYTKIRLN